MTFNGSSFRRADHRPFAVGVALMVASSGCALTQTTTTVRSTPGPATAQLKLSRNGLAPLAATWRQEGNAIVGTVSFARHCVHESSRTVRRDEVKTTATNSKAVRTWMIVGGLLSLGGIALMASSADKDETVYCGGSDGPEDGDRCSSEAGAYREVGVITLGTGLGGLLVGGVYAARKPAVETRALPSEELRTRGPAEEFCGDQAALEGMSVAAALPGAGTWTGRVATDGSARIDLPAKFTEATVAVVVGAVPASAAGMVAPGASLGEVALRKEKTSGESRGQERRKLR